jgi:hypothetical protein
MSKANIFFQIRKVDEEKRLVYGEAVSETPDLSGEVFDYESSKPYFEAWSAQVAKDTGGKSFGNVRSMHSKVAAGKVAEPLGFDDARKAINIAAKVVDDNEWEKVLEGVHTGFSIGGAYVKKWEDGDLTRYTADPGEISLVDRPCVPTAKFFDVVKSDGTVLRKVAFKEAAAPAADKPVTVDELTDDMAALLKAGSLSEAEMLTAIRKAADDKRLDALMFGKKDYSDKQRTSMADSGEAMKDGSFPIANKTDLHNAIQAVGRAKDQDAAKAHITTRAKALGLESELPADWSEKIAPAGEVKKVDNADNSNVNETNTDQGTGANGTATNGPKIGALMSFTFGEKAYQGKCTDLANGGVSIEVEGTGVFTCGKPTITAAEPGSGAEFSITGEFSTQAKKAVELTQDNLMKVAGAALKKGMYSVSTFASLLCSIQYLQADTAWEAEYEGDGSDMANKLKAWMKEGCNLLVAMVQEEANEMITGAPDVDIIVLDDDMLFLAAQTGGLAKSAALKFAAMRKVQTDPAAKVKERHTAVEKLTAKNTDLSTRMEKLATEASDLRKQVKARDEELAKAKVAAVAATEEITKLKVAAKAPAVMAVVKGADVIEDPAQEPAVVPVKDSFGKVDEVASALKKVHKGGGHRVNL